MHTFHHDAMKSPFEIHIAGQEEAYARHAAAATFRDIDHLESLLSRFLEDSDIARIRLLEPGQSVQVSPEAMECLLVALWAFRETAGAFDVMLGRGLDALKLDPDTFRVTASCELCNPALDLGGIGKGYALDRAADILGEWGITDAFLVAGPSTMLALGTQDGTPWPVGLHGNTVSLQDQAISASGTDVQGAHVLDPRDGTPAAGHQRAWALCPSAALADALSTAFMVMSGEQVAAFCQRHPHIHGHVVQHDGACISYTNSSYTGATS